VLFVGNYGHSPNVVAAEWLGTEIWPRVRAAVPSARCDVVGPGMSRGQKDNLLRAGIAVLGRVEDLPGCYRSSLVFANPIVSGGGMRGKVLEAFASGVPVVSTRMGMEGIAAEHGRHYLEAESADAFADAIVQYLRRPAVASAHGRSARTLVETTYDTRVVFSRLEAVYERAVAEKVDRLRTRASA
jgi:glycosyltransferase involved in cell wall biosynthesis